MDAANWFCTELLPLKQLVTTNVARIQNVSSVTDWCEILNRCKQLICVKI